jgi:hypothetical protein
MHSPDFSSLPENLPSKNPTAFFAVSRSGNVIATIIHLFLERNWNKVHFIRNAGVKIDPPEADAFNELTFAMVLPMLRKRHEPESHLMLASSYRMGL